jgi:hypothetical protein
MPSRVDLPTPLPAKMAARREGVHGLDAGLKNPVDALALERMRRRQVQFDGLLGLNRSQAVNRPSQAVEHAALERGANADAHWRAGGGDFAAGMDAVQVAQRHEQQVMVPKADNFGERDAVVPGGFDPANFTDGGDGALRFNDQPDDLHDAAAGLRHARQAHALERGVEAAGGAGDGGFHAEMDSRICSSLVSRRASRRPNRVCTRHPPRVISEEPMNLSGPASGRP